MPLDRSHCPNLRLRLDLASHGLHQKLSWFNPNQQPNIMLPLAHFPTNGIRESFRSIKARKCQ